MAEETVPLEASDEGDRKGLELGRAQGEALTRTLEHMMDEVAHDGREVRAGEYLVAYAVEEAEGMYMPSASGLEWVEPEDENAHVEIAVRDPADGRLIPALQVEATVIGEDGTEHGTSGCRCSGTPTSTTTARTGSCRAAAPIRCASAFRRRPSRGTTRRTAAGS